MNALVDCRLSLTSTFEGRVSRIVEKNCGLAVLVPSICVNFLTNALSAKAFSVMFLVNGKSVPVADNLVLVNGKSVLLNDESVLADGKSVLLNGKSVSVIDDLVSAHGKAGFSNRALGRKFINAVIKVRRQ